MKIRKLNLQNIKSFNQPQEVVFNDGLNFIIGSNGSGKSNLLEILQSCINDTFLEPAVVFSDENQDGRFLFKIDQRNKNTNNVEHSIFVPHYFADGVEMLVTIDIEIELTDIANFNSFRSEVGNLTDFENSKTRSKLFSNAITQFDLNLDYSDLAGRITTLIFKGTHLQVEENDGKLLSFLNYLRYSRFFFHYINFYNSSRNDSKLTDYFQSFHYFPPNREALDISNVRDVDLTNSQSRSINSFHQIEINQNSRSSSSEGLLSKLAENHFLGNEENKKFRSLTKKHLGIDFSINKAGSIYQNRFTVNFFRSEPGKQIPIRFSSGEKELFNFLAAIFLNEIKSGFILIDEPEIHLHPKWQRKLQDLLSDLSKTSSNQIISVTHSDHFVRSSLLSSLIRVHKENNESKVFTPDLKKLAQQKNKDLFLLLQSSNNTKVFFADKVVLVEGLVDRILFQCLIDIEQNAMQNPQVIEVIEVNGKHNFPKFETYLDTWKIPHYTIADLDYLSEIATPDIKKLFTYDDKKIRANLSEKNSTDATSLLSITDKLKAEQIVNKKDLSVLFSFSDYIASRHTVISKQNYATHSEIIKNFIKEKSREYKYILSEGSIEKYFSISKFSIESAIKSVEDIYLNKVSTPTELKEIVLSIVNSENSRAF